MNTTLRPQKGPQRLNLMHNAITQVVVLMVVYLLLLFVLPIGQENIDHYNLTMLEYKVLRFAIVAPSLLVWLAAFIGYSTFQKYAEIVKATPEGESYYQLARGCAWLAWSLPVVSFVSLICSSLFYAYPAFHAASIIITNYSDLILAFISFSLIGVGSRELLKVADLRLKLASARLIVVLFLIIGVLYCFLTFSHFDLHDLGSSHNPYYLPLWLMAIGVIIPYLYVWFVGLLSAYEISLYSKNTTGVLYKRALRLLATGIVTIIVSSIALQYLNGIEPRNGHLLLTPKLLLTVLFRVISGLGFITLSVGTVRLKKIEEV